MFQTLLGVGITWGSLRKIDACSHPPNVVIGCGCDPGIGIFSCAVKLGTTVIDCHGDEMKVLRRGRARPSAVGGGLWWSVTGGGSGATSIVGCHVPVGVGSPGDSVLLWDLGGETSTDLHMEF